jgi:hypothetical protein
LFTAHQQPRAIFELNHELAVVHLEHFGNGRAYGETGEPFCQINQFSLCFARSNEQLRL